MYKETVAYIQYNKHDKEKLEELVNDHGIDMECLEDEIKTEKTMDFLDKAFENDFITEEEMTEILAQCDTIIFFE